MSPPPPSLDGQTVWSNTAPVTIYSYAPFAIGGHLSALRARLAAALGVGMTATASLRARAPVLVGPFGQTMPSAASLRARAPVLVGPFGQTMPTSAALRARSALASAPLGMTEAAAAALRARRCLLVGSAGQTMSATSLLRARSPVAAALLGMTEASSGALSARRASASGGAHAWTPLDLHNLLVWLRADTGLTLSGSNVTAWADQSGNGYSFTGVVGHYPAYSATALGGANPGINFTGASVHNLRSTTNLNYAGSSAVTLYAVFAMTMPGSTQIPFESGTGASAGSYYDVQLTLGGAGTFTSVLFTDNSNYTYDSFTPGSGLSSPGQISIAYNLGLANTTRAAVRYNRAAATMTHGSGGAPTASTYANLPLNVGSRNGGSSLGVTMTLSELAICNGLPVGSDVAGFEAYAKNFWSLP